MEEIRAFACDELLQLSHGGNEVGGVLFGTRRNDLIRILTWRPIACEYAQGESLMLSSNDRMNLAVQLELARQTADLKDLHPLGCFISHLQGSVSLSPSDLEIYNGFFPDAWQVALVICPKGGGRAEAGFFVREANDKVHGEASYGCFDLQPPQIQAGVTKEVQPTPALSARRPPLPEQPPVAPSPSESPEDVREKLAAGHSASQPWAQSGPRPGLPTALRTGAPPEPQQDAHAAADPMAPESPERQFGELHWPIFALEEKLPAKERWLWAIPIALAIGLAVFVLYQRRTPAGNGVALHVSKEDQTVHLTWDVNSRAIRNSYRGEIEIDDGGKESNISLSSRLLHSGKMSYVPQSRDIAFEIIVYPPNGDPIHDFTRLVSPASRAATQPPQLLPASPAPATAPPAATPAPAIPPAATPPPVNQSALEHEVQQLKIALGRERARADESDNLVRILENRLGIQSTVPKPEERH
jgi:hypothetical protein